MFLKLLPSLVTQPMPRFWLRHMASLRTSEPPLPHPPPAAASEDIHKETVVEKLLEESARRLVSKEVDMNWDSSMAVIEKTEKHLPLRKPTEDELLKIRKALNPPPTEDC